MTTVYITVTNETVPRVLATSFWRAKAEGYAKRYNELTGLKSAHVLQVNVGGKSIMEWWQLIIVIFFATMCASVLIDKWKGKK